MSDEHREKPVARERMAAFLQDEEAEGVVFDDDSGAGRALLLGFTVISEWSDENGARWLSRLVGAGDGRNLPEWQVQGYLHNALHGTWEEDSTDA